MEPVITSSPEAIDMLAGEQRAVVQEFATLLPDEAASVGDDGYEYTRQDGTVEHAATAEEAIKLCPVLGKLAINDPESANLLLEMSSLGNAKMKEQPEKAERQERSEPKQLDQLDKKPAQQEVTQQSQAEAISQAPAESRTAKAVLTEVRDNFAQAAEGVSMPVVEPSLGPAELRAEKPDEAVDVMIVKASVVRDTKESRYQTTVAKPILVAQPELLQTFEVEAAEHVRRQLVDIPIQPEATTPIEQQQPEHIEQPSDAKAEIVVAIDAVSEAPEASYLDDYQEDGMELAEMLALHDVVAPPTIEYVAPTVARIPEQATWEDKLSEEPLGLFDDFAEALHCLVEAETVPANSKELTDPSELPVADVLQNIEVRPIPEAAPVPAITLVVAERLDECTVGEKAVVVPILQTIMKTVQVLEALKVEPVSEPLDIEVITVQLVEQVVYLFEQLGIKYETENIEQFIRVLLKPDFQSLQREAAESDTADLEHDGTHEAKRHFVQVVSNGLADVEYDAERLLGRLILLNSPFSGWQQLLISI